MNKFNSKLTIPTVPSFSENHNTTTVSGPQSQRQTSDQTMQVVNKVHIRCRYLEKIKMLTHHPIILQITYPYPLKKREESQATDANQ